MGTQDDQPVDSSPAALAGGDPALLLAIVRLISRWTSQEFQQQVIGACGIPLDSTASRAIYLLGIAGGSVTPSRIAADMHLSRPSTSKLLTRLSDARLLQRSPGPGDRRSVTIDLTELGQATFDQLFAAGLTMISGSTQSWSAAERRALAALLPRFVDGLLADDPL